MCYTQQLCQIPGSRKHAYTQQLVAEVHRILRRPILGGWRLQRHGVAKVHRILRRPDFERLAPTATRCCRSTQDSTKYMGPRRLATPRHPSTPRPWNPWLRRPCTCAPRHLCTAPPASRYLTGACPPSRIPYPAILNRMLSVISRNSTHLVFISLILRTQR